MDALLQFFKGIASAITGFFDFLFSLVGDIIYLVQLTGKVLSSIPSFLSWLPSPVSALILTAITIAVLYKILGRE